MVWNLIKLVFIDFLLKSASIIAKLCTLYTINKNQFWYNGYKEASLFKPYAITLNSTVTGTRMHKLKTKKSLPQNLKEYPKNRYLSKTVFT